MRELPTQMKEENWNEKRKRSTRDKVFKPWVSDIPGEKSQFYINYSVITDVLTLKISVSSYKKG